MSEGNWRVGVYLDEAASDSQAERLGVALVLALATIWYPWLAPGLHAAPRMMS